jgi:hypothetical protein
MGPRAYETGHYFYDNSSVYHHKLKGEIITDPLHVLEQIINHHNLKREILMD